MEGMSQEDRYASDETLDDTIVQVEDGNGMCKSRLAGKGAHRVAALSLAAQQGSLEV